MFSLHLGSLASLRRMFGAMTMERLLMSILVSWAFSGLEIQRLGLQRLGYGLDEASETQLSKNYPS